LRPGFQKTSYNEDQVHRDTNTDHRNRIQQTSHDEGFGLQRRSHFRLTSGGFQQLATQQGEADAGSQSATTQDDSRCDEYDFHLKLLSFQLIKGLFGIIEIRVLRNLSAAC
jgi:hypothetical protein